MKKKKSLTGIKPTGMPHWGNYFGAIKPALEMANTKEYQGYYFIADYHSLTTHDSGQSYRNNILEVAAAWLSLGLDPQKTILYQQSDVSEICELNWILSCFTAKGLMNRAHGYKSLVQDNEKHKRDKDQGVSMGFYSYPILMAADILIVESDVVPVGTDQLQHIEMARDIASAFNRHYGEVLKLPCAVVRNDLLVPGIDGRKMSKSYNNHIPLFLSEKKLKKIIGKIVTDSVPSNAPKDPKTSLIFDLYKFFATESDVTKLKIGYENGISWGEAKEILYDTVNSCLKRPRETYNKLISDPIQIKKILQIGAERVREKTASVLLKVKKIIGAV